MCTVFIAICHREFRVQLATEAELTSMVHIWITQKWIIIVAKPHRLWIRSHVSKVCRWRGWSQATLENASFLVRLYSILICQYQQDTDYEMRGG